MFFAASLTFASSILALSSSAAFANEPPNAPYSPSPPDNATNVLPNPTLRWSCSDPDNNQLVYDVYFGTETDPPLARADWSFAAFTPVGLQDETRYYWRVVARDSHGAETSGPIWTFLTMVANNPPTIFSPSPADGGVGSPNTVLSWSASDPDGDPLRFSLYFGTPIPTLLDWGNFQSYDPPGELTVGQTYYWYVIVGDGKEDVSSPMWSLYIANPTPVTMREPVLNLGQNHPNPFNPQTTIPYEVPGDGLSHVRLFVSDAAGRLVRSLVNQSMSAGAHVTTWDGKDDGGSAVASGVYFCVLDVNGERRTRKMSLLK